MDKLYIKSIASEKKKSCTTIHTVNNKPFRKKNYILNIYRELKLWITIFSIFFKVQFMEAQDNFLTEQLNYENVNTNDNFRDAKFLSNYQTRNTNICKDVESN